MAKGGTMRGYLIRLFEDTHSRAFWIIHGFSGAVIVASLFSILLESDPGIFERHHNVLLTAEYFFTAVFTIEYIIFIYLAEKKLKYIFSFNGLIDFLSIAPTYWAFASYHYLQILRVTRLLRLFRLLRLLKVLQLVQSRYRRANTEWALLKFNLVIYLSAYALLGLTFSVLLFHIEEGIPGSQIRTIQDAAWSVISALSSVGFGDTFPASFPGRLFLGFVMLVGVGFLSFAVLTFGRFFQLLLFGEDIERELKNLGRPRKGFMRAHRTLLEQEARDTIQ